MLNTIDLHSGAHTVVRRSGAAPIPPEAVSRPRAQEFPAQPSADGQPRSAHAWFYPPRLPGLMPAEGEAPPLVVMLHGGPTSHATPAFKVGAQFWTTRGYAPPHADPVISGATSRSPASLASRQ